MSELANCPFCGSDETFIKPWSDGNSGDWWLARCSKCGAQTTWHCQDESHAITAWNRRAPAEPSAGWRGINSSQSQPCGLGPSDPEAGLSSERSVEEIVEMLEARIERLRNPFTRAFIDVAEMREGQEDLDLLLAGDLRRASNIILLLAAERGRMLDFMSREAASPACGPVGELDEPVVLSPSGGGGEGSSRTMSGGSPPLRAAKSDIHSHSEGGG